MVGGWIGCSGRLVLSGSNLRYIFPHSGEPDHVEGPRLPRFGGIRSPALPETASSFQSG